tara:strand:+ start:89 stop:289 length:201 start_codon:yes stop_codon:yes gene_type:complete
MKPHKPTKEKVMETTVNINSDIIYLVCYSKAVDLWIAEQGEECCEDKTVIKQIAKELYTEFYKGMP